MSTINSRSYFVWVRVVMKGKPPDNAESVHGASSPVQPPTFRILNPNRPPRAANQEGSCFWMFDKDYAGVSTCPFYIDYFPHIGTRDDAICWLTNTREGHAWVNGAETYELLSFDEL